MFISKFSNGFFKILDPNDKKIVIGNKTKQKNWTAISTF